MSSITKIKVADTIYDIKDNVSGYITKDVDDLTNYYDKTQVDYNIEQVSDEIPTRTSQLTNDSGFVGTAALAGKQDTLVSGTNIKTINGANILGSGNLVVESQGEINLVDDVQLNGTSIVADKVANIHVVDNYGNNNPLTTQQNLQDVHDELDAKLPYTMLDFNETTNHIKTVEGTDLPVAYTRIDGNYEQETTTGKQLVDLVPSTSMTPTGSQYCTYGTFFDNILNKNVLRISSTNIYPTVYYNLPNALEDNKYYAIKYNYRTDVVETENTTIWIGCNGSVNNWDNLGVVSQANKSNNWTLKTYKIKVDKTRYPNGYTKILFSLGYGLSDNITKKDVYISDFMIYEITESEYNDSSYSYIDFEPYTNGPSPNPEYPQEIEVIEDNIDVKITGENLFNPSWIEYRTTNGITATLENDHILLNGTATANAYINITIPNGILSGSHTWGFISDATLGGSSILRSSGGNVNIPISTTWNKSTFDSTNVTGGYFYVSNGTTLNNCKVYIYVGKGIINIINYEPYKSATKTIDLQDEFVGKVGDVKDELTMDKNGNVSLLKKIGKVVLDGSESGWTSAYKAGDLENYFTGEIVNASFLEIYGSRNEYRPIICDYLLNTNNRRIARDAIFNWHSDSNDTHYFDIRLNKSIADDLTSFKNWLSANTPVVYYALSTPYTVDLGNIGPIDMFVGTNNILVSTNIDTNYNMRIYNKSGLIPTLTSQLINDSGFITQSGLGDYALASEAAHTMTMEVNTDYVLTSQLKNKNGAVVNTTTVDLPIEGLVMNGRYDTATKKVVLTLKNGNTIEFSIADLISDRQPLIDSTHKLDSDLINTTGQTNQFVLASDKTNWNNKQAGLVSGVNIKTINNISLLGAGNINISGGGGGGGSTTHHNELDNLDYENSGHTGFQPAGNYALATNVLGLDNTQSYTPTSTYHPATKKYVDDKPTILYGTSTPTSSQGKNGDIYLKYTA